MASDTPPTPPSAAPVQPAHRRRWRHWLLITLLSLLAVLLMLGAFLAWLVNSEHGAQTGASMLNRWAPSLHIEGVSGRLGGPLRIARLTLNSPERKIVLQDILLEWQPMALLQRRLHVRHLGIRHIGFIGSTQQSEPPQLPASLALPLKLKIDQVQVDGGSLSWGALDLIELGAFGFNLDYDAVRYRLGIDSFSARTTADANPLAAQLSGQATLADSKPYAVSAEITSAGEATVQRRAIAASGRMTASGSLEKMQTTIDLAIRQTQVGQQEAATGEPQAELQAKPQAALQADPQTEMQATAQVQGSAVLQAFSGQPLGATHITVRGLDLSTLAASLPRTLLDANLSATGTGAGELRLINSAAGTYNDARLPLTDLQLQFRQDAGRVELPRIVINTGSARRAAGSIQGSGTYQGGALNLKLTTQALDLQKLDGRMRATRLQGDVVLKHADGQQDFALDLTEPRKKNPLMVTARASLSDQRFEIRQAALKVGSGEISAVGHMALDGRQTFAAQGKISRFRLQDVGNFSNFPALDLNGNFSLSGARAPQLQADLAFHIADSRLAGQSLQGDGSAQLRADSIRIPKLLLAAGSNRLSMQGELSESHSRLNFELSAPELQQFGPGFGGGLHASGSATGTLRQPHILAEWRANKLRLPGQLQVDTLQGKADLQLDRSQPFFLKSARAETSLTELKAGAQQLAGLNASLRFAPQPDAPLALNLRGFGWKAGQLRADSLTLTANGTTASHKVEIKVNEPSQSWLLQAGGGLQQLARAPAWRGTIDRIDAAGSFVTHLAAPAPLLVSAQRVQLDRLRLEAQNGVIAIEQFLREAQRVSTRGHIERLQVAPLMKFFTSSPIVTTDLELDGEWNLTVAGGVNGTASIRRRQGDVVMRGGAPVALGLRTLQASVNASGSRVALKLAADGQQLGHIDIVARAGLARTADGLTIAANAPLSGRAELDMPAIAWVGPLLSATLITEGALHAALDIDGSLAAPRLNGQIKGEALRVFLTDTGIDLRQGTLAGEFNNSALRLNTLRFAHGGGHISASGTIRLAAGKPAAQLALAAERYPLLNRSDRRLVISGKSTVGLDQNIASATGEFLVDSGFIDIGRQDMPQLSDDVVIVGRTQKSAGKLLAALDIKIGLGKGVTVKGRGLDALLQGEIRLQNTAGVAPQARGTLNVTKGSYTAYGRELAIEQGVLRFVGPINNPSLDILAMRRGQEVEAGVTVRGTVLAPRVTLVSEPTVADAEKLSWLVLGRGLGSAGEGDLGALQAAAGALLSEGAVSGVQSQIATALGLDDFGVSAGSDGLQERIVTIGKRLSSRLYVSYQQGLETASSILLLRYTLSPRVSLEAETGARSVFSIFYNIAFD